jgi:POT family proton-dependent oligopeptide transporter
MFEPRHRRDLLALCSGVAFERAAYYGLQSLLALYLADVLADARAWRAIWLLPELAQLLGVEGLALAGVVTGGFVSATILSPVIGALVADRLIGQHRAILLGGAMMAAGHGLLVIEAALLPALAAIALGAGFFKGPVAARLNQLYPPDDPRKVEGFRLFYIAINIAGLIAPLVIGTLGERAHWHAGFALSCGSMLVGLAIYRFAVSTPDDPVPVSEPSAAEVFETARQTATYPGLLLLAASLAMLSVPNAQITNAYLLWAKQSFDRVVWGWEVPASWIIAADGLLSLCALAATGLFWRWRERQGDVHAAETKAVIGALFVVGGTGLLVLAGVVHGPAPTPVIWGLGFQLLNSVGLANVFPAAMALFGQASPRRFAATAMAGFYLALFVGGVASTVFASQFTGLPIAVFWMLHALCAILGALGLLMCWTKGRKALAIRPLAA